jgi:hypothetical protein
MDLSNVTAPFKNVLKELISKDNEAIWRKILE